MSIYPAENVDMVDKVYTTKTSKKCNLELRTEKICLIIIKNNKNCMYLRKFLGVLIFAAGCYIVINVWNMHGKRPLDPRGTRGDSQERKEGYLCVFGK